MEEVFARRKTKVENGVPTEKRKVENARRGEPLPPANRRVPTQFAQIVEQISVYRVSGRRKVAGFTKTLNVETLNMEQDLILLEVSKPRNKPVIIGVTKRQKFL